MDVTTVAAFLGVVALAYIVPGPDLAVVLRFGSRGRRLGRAAVLGILTGLSVHVVASALGLSALIAGSPTAFTVVKIMGAGYLFVLGVQSIVGAFRGPLGSKAPPADDVSTDVHGWRLAFRQGLVCNILNPKAILFFVSLLPQFIDAGRPALGQTVVLGLATVLFGATWWFAVVHVVGRVQKALLRERVRRLVDAVTGFAFVGLGARLLF